MKRIQFNSSQIHV